MSGGDLPNPPNPPPDPEEPASRSVPNVEPVPEPGGGSGGGSPAPYLDQPTRRAMLDESKPWLEAGRSWRAEAARVEAFLDERRGRPRRFYERRDAQSSALQQRAVACASLAGQLASLRARGWVVWHDVLAPGTRNVMDHCLVGPGGVIVLQTLPVLDDVASPKGQFTGPVPGPRTARAIATSWSILSEQIVECLDAAVRALLPSWSVPVRGHHVLVGESIRATFTDILRPWEVEAFIARQGAWFSPMHVGDLVLELDQIIFPAPLDV